MAIAVQNKSLEFLKKLALNNNRDWFNAHKKEFKSVEADIKIVYNTVFNNLKVHDDVDTMKLFRIYRDVRFSKNKLPYKTHFGGSFSRVKPALRGGYYLHIAPNDESFIATGFWEPNKEDLLRIRKEIEMDEEEMRGIINQSSLKDIWGNLIGDELVSAPRGFDKNHRAIDLIRKKQYIFTKKFTDKDVLSEDFIYEVNSAFKAIRPYFNYMSDVLTTDLNGESLI
jgi:uncharacterized protein (TIGR02453 family)